MCKASSAQVQTIQNYIPASVKGLAADFKLRKRL